MEGHAESEAQRADLRACFSATRLPPSTRRPWNEFARAPGGRSDSASEPRPGRVSSVELNAERAEKLPAQERLAAKAQIESCQSIEV